MKYFYNKQVIEIDNSSNIIYGTVDEENRFTALSEEQSKFYDLYLDLSLSFDEIYNCKLSENHKLQNLDTDNIDKEIYRERVVELIREKYSADDEISILRKKLAGVDENTFLEYNLYCENCKKQAKLEQINK